MNGPEDAARYFDRARAGPDSRVAAAATYELANLRWQADDVPSARKLFEEAARSNVPSVAQAADLALGRLASGAPSGGVLFPPMVPGPLPGPTGSRSGTLGSRRGRAARWMGMNAVAALYQGAVWLGASAGGGELIRYAIHHLS